MILNIKEYQTNNDKHKTKSSDKYKTKGCWALAGIAQWIERRLQTKESLVQFPVGTHAWVADQVPSMGRARRNHILMFLSLSFSFPSPLSKNK